ncbi:MAG: Hsp20/alpha crystallin family protein [Anaerolineae bacterium]|nr:Hsp20/alpha crystallin family protein [Anaerolineae bacterium]
MSIVRWEPFRDMMTLREAMDRLFEESFVSPRRREWLAPAEGALALDVYETEDSLVVKSSIPGVNPEDVDISIKGNILSISGETKEEEEVKEENYVRRERRYGTFSRSLALPDGIDTDKAAAEFEDGVLKLTIPKVPEAKPKIITIKSKEKK